MIFPTGFGFDDPPRFIEVTYIVQKGDRLSTILRKTQMSMREWKAVNEYRDPQRRLRVGEEIVVKDPIATCQATMEGGYLLSPEFLEIVLRDQIDYVRMISCKNDPQYGAFKPLQAFTGKLER